MSSTTKAQAASVETTATVATDGLTAYAAAKAVNAVFEAHGLEKRIPTQMMYNYTTARVNAKKEPFIAVTDDGRISAEGLKTWMTKYFAKQGIEL